MKRLKVKKRKMLLHMGLPSDPEGRTLEQQYQSFRRRVEKKCKTPYFDSGDDPVLLRLWFNSSSMDTVGEVRPEFGSFEPIIASKGENKGKEIGFRATAFAIFELETKMVVLKSGKAFLECTTYW
jgi:hypothetical protein